MNKHYVYGLVDPTSSAICYIGYTSCTPEKRLGEHLEFARKSRSVSEKNIWLRSLQDEGKKPDIVILQIFEDAKDALLSEREWIERGYASGWPLLNIEYAVRVTLSNHSVESSLMQSGVGAREDGKTHADKGFPIKERRPLSDSEVTRVQEMAKNMSKNRLCRTVYGAKSGRYMEWINEALN